jgi:hypothetical protein
MRIIQTAVLVALLASPKPSSAQAPTAAVKQAAYARVALARAVASHPWVRAAVAARNAQADAHSSSGCRATRSGSGTTGPARCG